LLAGAGGGFDIFCGLPLYFGLKNAGKTVHLANLSFSYLDDLEGNWIYPETMLEVTARTDKVFNIYFPELYLAQWFAETRQEEVSIYTVRKTGVQPLFKSYQKLVEKLNIDTVILIDGGTDSLMRGDEAGLGTPNEDATSIIAADMLNVPRKMLVCLGFGVDAFHGVCHTHFLENVAELTSQNAFLGMWSLMQQMPEVELYRQAAAYVFEKMQGYPSIVSTSILAAIEGRFGDYHATERTRGSQLFINPLMSLYWCFQLAPVAERILYADDLRFTTSISQVSKVIWQFRNSYQSIKSWANLPM
jgi:hypothetical protein